MYPVYKDMTSHPYQRNDIPSTQCYHPGWGLAVPSQMKEDPSSSTCTHESWPHNYGYPVPMQCHNCCTHGQHPGYYNFRPPCSHFPPPPPPPPYHHFYGGYPPYPQPYTMYYGPPPPYSMELPRYEYDRSVPRDQFHCCGSLDHPHHVKEGSNVKIEEHEPDAEKKKIESSSPSQVNNFPYPIMWIPPEYTNTMNKQQPRRLAENEGDQQHVLPYVKKPWVQQIPIEKESQENEGTTLDRKSNQNVQSAEQDPNVGYGWFPLDINRLKQLMEGGDAKQPRDQVNRSKNEMNAPDVGNKDVNTQPSFPLFWMPYNGREKGSSKDQVESTADGTASDGSHVLPGKNELADNKVENQSTSGVDDNRIGTTGADKKKIVKTIPVKQLDESAPKVSKKEEEHKQDKTKNFTSTQSSSTAKKPKLPPICLRIDPPKKKKSNGSSRSPSPPGDKKRQDSDDSSLKRKYEHPRTEINIKDAEKKTHSHGAEMDKKGSEILKENAINAEKNVVQQADSYNFNDVKGGEHRAEAQVLQATKESCQESKKERKVMSEMEAAVAIQTAYRGHNVRRSEPIQKLKQIAKVHEEAIQVKKNLEDLESHAPVDVKEKTAIGETIMNLLLKLDSMQGLHQSIRDVRKSVANQLISLQEKLDSITSQQTVVLAQDTSIAPAVEEPLRDSDLVRGSEVINGSTGQPNKDSSMDGDKSQKVAEEENSSSCDPSSSEPLSCQDGVSSYDDKETFNTSLVNMESQEGSLSDIMVSAARRTGDVAPTSLDLKMKDELGVSEVESATGFQKLIADTSPVEYAEAQNIGIENQEAKLVSELPQEVGITVEKDLLIGNKNQEENLLPEMPQDINEESFANMSISEDAAVENDLVTGNESHKPDSLSVLPRDDVGVDEKDVKLLERPQENENSVSKMEKEPHEDLPPEVNSDDGQVQTEVENSSNLNKDQVDQLSEKQEVKSENMMVVGNKTHKPLQLSSLENVSGEEADSISSSTNIGTSKETSEISNVMDQKVENSVNLSKDQEVDHPNEKQEMIKEDTMAVMDENHEPLEPFSLETVSGQEVESTSSFTNVKPSEETSKLCNVMDVSEHESKADNAEHGHAVETLVPELDVQQSKDEDVALGLSLEGQNSAASLEMDEQVDKKIIEENEKLRVMLEKLLAAGKEQQEVISNLNGKVKDLEKKLGGSKKKKSAKHPRVRISRRLCGKSDIDSLSERTMGAS